MGKPSIIGYNEKILATGRIDSWAKCLVCANLSSACLNRRDSCGSYKNNGENEDSNHAHILSRLRKKVAAMNRPVLVVSKPQPAPKAVAAPPKGDSLYQERLDRIKGMRARTFKFYCYVRDIEYCTVGCDRSCGNCPAQSNAANALPTA